MVKQQMNRSIEEVAWNLPDGWEWRALQDVVEIHDNLRKPVKANADSGPFPYCGANGIIDSIDDFTHEGDFVLLAEDGGHYGPGEYSAYRMSGKFWANNHVHILKGKEGIIDNAWLRYALTIMDLRSSVKGATGPS